MRSDGGADGGGVMTVRFLAGDVVTNQHSKFRVLATNQDWVWVERISNRSSDVRDGPLTFRQSDLSAAAK